MRNIGSVVRCVVLEADCGESLMYRFSMFRLYKYMGGNVVTEELDGIRAGG